MSPGSSASTRRVVRRREGAGSAVGPRAHPSLAWGGGRGVGQGGGPAGERVYCRPGQGRAHSQRSPSSRLLGSRGSPKASGSPVSSGSRVTSYCHQPEHPWFLPPQRSYLSVQQQFVVLVDPPSEAPFSGDPRPWEPTSVSIPCQRNSLLKTCFHLRVKPNQVAHKATQCFVP